MHSIGASSSPDRGGNSAPSSSSRLISGGPSRLNNLDSSPASIAGPSSP